MSKKAAQAQPDLIVPIAMIGCLMIFVAAAAVLMGQNFVGNSALVIGGACIILTLALIFKDTPPIIPPQALAVDIPVGGQPNV
jgi:hypothetical protein